MNIDFSIGKGLDLIAQKFETWLAALVQGLPNFFLALMVLVGAFYLAKMVRNIVNRVIVRVTDHQSVQNLTGTIVYLSVITVGLFIALGILQLDKTVTSLLAGAGVIGLALGFAFQDIASNFVSGIFIAFGRPYQVGDIIEAKSFLGKVTAIELRTTTITSFEGLETMVPNKYLFTEPVTNYTNTPQRRIDLKVGVSYGDDLELVERLLKEELVSLPNRIEYKGIDIFYTEFGDSSINFEAKVWVTYVTHQEYLETRSEAIKKIKKVFDNNEITIPFPIRTLDFGIKGGQKLSEVPLSVRSGVENQVRN